MFECQPGISLVLHCKIYSNDLLNRVSSFFFLPQDILKQKLAMQVS